MKTKIMTLFVVALMTVSLSVQGKTRSYFCQQINAPVSAGPTATLNQATFVEWNDDDNSIRMMDGTVWRYQGMRNGCHVYSFWRALFKRFFYDADLLCIWCRNARLCSSDERFL